MNNLQSCKGFILGLYQAILSDCCLKYPTRHREFERDYNRLSSAIETNGVQFFLVTLVQYGKHFDKCLSTGRLSASHLHHFGVVRRGEPIPRLFRGLILRVFDRDGCLLDSPDIVAIDFLRQLFRAVKRFKISSPDSAARKLVEEFYQTDCRLPAPSLSWGSEEFDASCAENLSVNDWYLLRRWDSYQGKLPKIESADIERGHRLTVLQQVFDFFSTVIIGRYNPYDYRCKHGPGAVAERVEDRYKYHFPSWSASLESFFPMADFAFANYLSWADSLPTIDLSDLYGTASRMIVVPKTYDGPRLIAAEPTANQWCQQNILAFLVDRSKSRFVKRSLNFSDQSLNGKLALEASHTGSHATVDLSAASDRVSCYLIERFFRRNPEMLLALNASRSSFVMQDIEKKVPKYIRLRKFSTMGSACTFPIESFVFLAIAVASIIFDDRTTVSTGSICAAIRQVRVYGDDIIVPVPVMGTFRKYAEDCFLLINPSKTFETGKFRESCGVDAFDGVNVSSASVLRIPRSSEPESVLSVVDAHNNFFNKKMFCVCNYLRRTVSSLKQYCFPEVAPGSGVVGWYTHEGLEDNSHIRDRWNSDLQRREYHFTRLFSRDKRTPPTTNAGLLEYFSLKTPRYLEGDRLGVADRQRSLMLRRSWDALV